MDHSIWDPCIQALSPFYHCLAPDLPGHGDSPELKEKAFTIHDLVSELQFYLQEKGCSNLYVAGHSMGGHIALLLALKAPSRVRSLFLVSPAGLEHFTKTEKQRMKQWMGMAEKFGNDQANRFFLEKIAREPWPNSFPASSYQTLFQCIRAMMEEPVRPYAPHIEQPLRILMGTMDGMIPNRFLHPDLSAEQMVRSACSEFPDGQYQMVKNGGHFMPNTHPDLVREWILEQIREKREDDG